MATLSHNPRGVPYGKSGAAESFEIEPPPSLLLRIFLLLAFLVTAAAFVVGQREDASGQDDVVLRKNESLHRMLAEKTKSQEYARIGFQEENLKHYDLAISNFQNALIVLNSADGHYNLANALLLQGKLTVAYEHFKTALALDPKLRDAYTSWGQALLDQGDADGAARVYAEASAKNPDDSLFHFKLAQAQEVQRKDAKRQPSDVVPR
jgi:tetratricopeptide (TPR) repeat protein